MKPSPFFTVQYVADTKSLTPPQCFIHSFGHSILPTNSVLGSTSNVCASILPNGRNDSYRLLTWRIVHGTKFGVSSLGKPSLSFCERNFLFMLMRLPYNIHSISMVCWKQMSRDDSFQFLERWCNKLHSHKFPSHSHENTDGYTVRNWEI
jgi:hypothetical protein